MSDNAEAKNVSQRAVPLSILHLDMDAFFAAIEILDNPHLRGRPVIVGAPPDRRGVVSTASYEARRYGVHSAMPSRTAYKLCPHGVFLPVRMERYQEFSAKIREIMHRFTPFVEPLSVDEAFLDITGLLQNNAPSPATIARELKQRIYAETRLTASVGVARNKFLAKLASDFEKPDGLTVVPGDPAEVRAFLAPLKINVLWGVGEVTGEKLRRFGFHTVGDLQDASIGRLRELLGQRTAWHLHEMAFGRDDRPVVTEHEEKSISNEDTFPEDCTDPAHVEQTLINLTENVGRRLRESGKLAKTAQLKLRFADFKTITRQRGLEPSSCNDRDLLAAALQLFRLVYRQAPHPVRLVGFEVNNLIEPHSATTRRQPLLWDTDSDEKLELPRTQKERRLDRAVDELREQYGKDILQRKIRRNCD